ncbi:exo-beta-N-acetylmuramidase NamZ domain-containing protein [Alteromonas gracilis]|uniref:exo-beta-N-acetylmuramidase NamZ family protein n=1 Tax=Alteromonas gracilis TaxID=1479524 RepID=UPI003735FBE1
MTNSQQLTKTLSGVLRLALVLFLPCLMLNGCASDHLSTHVYTSKNNDEKTTAKDAEVLAEKNSGPVVDMHADEQTSDLTFTSNPTHRSESIHRSNIITVGAQQFEKYLPLLEGKRVSLVVNQSALVSTDNTLSATSVLSPQKSAFNGGAQHLLDALLQRNVNVVSIMSPEHGFRGDKGAGEKINSDIDVKTGLPIHSLYGTTKKPTPNMLANTDVIVFDIQDVGVRFYTYLSTLHYVMEAAFEQNIHVIVLDRPNPNGKHVDGPVLQPGFTSFIGMHPIPVLHGMTLGELAKMMIGEQWLKIDANAYFNAKLTVVPVGQYKRAMHYSLPVPPSPNLPNDLAIGLYPTLCFFEGTDVSIGRGTDFPFQLIGHPDVEFGESKIQVQPNSAAPHPKYNGAVLLAHVFSYQTLHDASSNGLPFSGLHLATLVNAYSRFSAFNNTGAALDKGKVTFFTRPEFFDKLAGTDELRLQIEAGKTTKEIQQSWQQKLSKFKEKRETYLLYDDAN